MSILPNTSRMKVHISIKAGRQGGKTHLADALKDFFLHTYPNIGPIDVTITEMNPSDSLMTGRTFQVNAGPDLSQIMKTDDEGNLSISTVHTENLARDLPSGEYDIRISSQQGNLKAEVITPRVAENQTLWREFRDKHPGELYYAVTPYGKHPRPNSVTHLFSAPLNYRGPRYWAFATQGERDDFVKHHLHASTVWNEPLT
jgi:hypothetical protein